jgi:hypothetical protein
MNKTIKFGLAVVPFLLAVGCTDPNKLPAETAIKAAETAAATLTAEIEKAAPEQVKAFKDGLAAAKAAVAKQDFKGARAAAEALPGKAAEAVAAAQKKMAEVKKAFEDGAAQLGEKVGALKAKAEELAKAKKLPKGVTKDAVKKAQETVAELEAGVAKAKEEAGKDAAAAAETVKGLLAKADEALASLSK